jgi:EAL domain-containing protein (putative c-di-GMP-specific phosphodiesterase class I)
VLFVDDEPHVTANFLIMFRKAPFKVLTANSGREALSVLEGTVVDIIVSDEQMPDMPGSVLLSKVRQLHPEIVRIILTGEASLDAAIDAINGAGIFRFLRKPCSVDDLTACLKEAACARDGQRRVAKVESDANTLHSLGDSFERALDAMYMVVQPVVSLVDRSVFAYEALVRTREPSVPHAGAFFEIAERLQRVRELDRKIRIKCAEIAARLADGPLLLINVHPESLNDPSLVAEDSPLALFAPRIIFEITERSSLHSMEGAKETVARLRAAGYRIAVDDLGAGYAGLTSIALLHPEVVKLDMELVRNLDTSATRVTLISGMVALCKQLDIAVIAEGVETAAEMHKLEELECELLQGYYFARPGPPFPEVSWPEEEARPAAPCSRLGLEGEP